MVTDHLLLNKTSLNLCFSCLQRRPFFFLWWTKKPTIGTRGSSTGTFVGFRGAPGPNSDPDGGMVYSSLVSRRVYQTTETWIRWKIRNPFFGDGRATILVSGNVHLHLVDWYFKYFMENVQLSHESRMANGQKPSWDVASLWKGSTGINRPKRWVNLPPNVPPRNVRLSLRAYEQPLVPLDKAGDKKLLEVDPLGVFTA